MSERNGAASLACSDALLACPFCGGEAEIEKSGFGWFREWSANCTKCWAITHGYAGTNLWKGSRQEAIDTWNRRHANNGVTVAPTPGGA
jgi:hypothetical protein